MEQSPCKLTSNYREGWVGGRKAGGREGKERETEGGWEEGDERVRERERWRVREGP